MIDETQQNKLDKWDIAVSVSSGALTAALDVLWVNDISLEKAHTWGSDKVDEFVKKVAKLKGYSGGDIAVAIKKLEDDYPMDGDKVTHEFGGGGAHHLRDFSHHPTPIGLIFSLLMQFTGKGYGTNTKGEFVSYEIPGWKKKGFDESIYQGIIAWIFHLISDVAGSSGTRRDITKEGTGLPGPMLSFLKEISSVPGIRNIAGRTDAKSSPNKEQNYVFSQTCSELFNGTLLGEHDENGKIMLHGELRFDFRTELGIVNESINKKQYIPVLINELIVAAFYSVRCFVDEMEANCVNTIAGLSKIDIARCLPWKNERIRHMRMIAVATFSTIDISASAIKSALKHKDNRSAFALDFMQGINYWGVGSLVIATNSEVLMNIQKMHAGFVAAAEIQKQKMIAKLPSGQQTYDLGKYATEATISITQIGTPIGFISAAIGVYDEINKALTELKISKEERARIQEECSLRIEIIRENRRLMQQMVEEYFDRKITVFTESFDIMDRAITENDIDSFIIGNNMIQKELSGRTVFETKEEFDDLMQSNLPIKF